MKKSTLAIIIATAIVVAVFLLSRQQDSKPIAEADTSSLRQTPSGEVIGFSDSWDTHAWLGIPYAEAPVADLRWRAPQQLKPWTGTREALSYGSPCTQLWGPMSGIDDGEEGQVVGAEDCLTLNIWAPAFTAQQLPGSGEQLPAMVWLHGGGNTIGTANTYPGPHLAGGQRVVYVAINYRMGPLGWFSHAALRGTAANRDDARKQLLNMSPQEIRNYLYRKTSLELYSIFDELGYGMFPAPQIFRDGHVIPEQSLLQLFREPGAYNIVAIIVGSNRDEQKSFMAQDPRFVERRFGLLPRVKNQAEYDRITGYYSDQWKALAVDEPAEILSKSQGATVYAYTGTRLPRTGWPTSPVYSAPAMASR
jgi:carboxylesterase type B